MCVFIPLLVSKTIQNQTDMEDSRKKNRLKLVKNVVTVLYWYIILNLFFDTMIGIVPLLTLLTLSSLFGTLIFYKILNRWSDDEFKNLNFSRRFLLHFLFHCSIGCGAITTLLFLTTNKFLSDNEEKRVVVNVVDEKTMRGAIFFTVEYDEERLNIIADAQTTEQSELPFKLELRLKNGFWGYDIIEDWKHVNNFKQ